MLHLIWLTVILVQSTEPHWSRWPTYVGVLLAAVFRRFLVTIQLEDATTQARRAALPRSIRQQLNFVISMCQPFPHTQPPSKPSTTTQSTQTTVKHFVIRTNHTSTKLNCSKGPSCKLISQCIWYILAGSAISLWRCSFSSTNNKRN